METQWRFGMAGPVGLDYSALYPMLDRLNLDSDSWLQILDDVRVMESSALEAIHKE